MIELVACDWKHNGFSVCLGEFLYFLRIIRQSPHGAFNFSFSIPFMTILPFILLIDRLVYLGVFRFSFIEASIYIFYPFFWQFYHLFHFEKLSYSINFGVFMPFLYIRQPNFQQNLSKVLSSFSDNSTIYSTWYWKAFWG